VRTADRWRERPIAAATLRLLVFVVPVASALGSTLVLRRLVPPPAGFGPGALWWVMLAAVALVVAVAVERQARRILPLATLLKLGMLFPDRAPSRFAVAREIGSVRRLGQRLHEIEHDPEAADEASSARTILALTIKLQDHDRKTRGHAERVRVYTDMLAEELRLPKEDRYRLRWAALLHDIGKLSVDARVLNKDGELDDHDWDEVRRHPLEGARIAAPLLSWLGPWAWAITEHHERMDGTGYPERLHGHEISLAARIVAVADAYDSMTAARSYKKPIAVRSARQELLACAGAQFDPDIVRAFFAISLPRLLWKTGPVSLLFHLPYLRELNEIGRQGLAVAGQSVTAATVAASVTVMAVGGPGVAVAKASSRSAGVASGTGPTVMLADPDGAASPADLEERMRAQGIAVLSESVTPEPGAGHAGDGSDDGPPASDEGGSRGDAPDAGDDPALSQDAPDDDGVPASNQDDGPGASEHAPGHDEDGPGASEDAQADDGAPGNSEHVPGQENEPPGQVFTPPGQSGSSPGNSASAPGQSGSSPGNSGSAPGQSNPSSE
jgi:hypothetical protein